jgi:uncharacterized protein (TIGR03083 family)
MTQTIDVSMLQPLTHDDAMQLQADELERTLHVLRALADDEWSAQTECPAWDVHRMYLHVLGACEGAELGEMIHQMRVARRRQRRGGGPLEANLSAVQVEERMALTPAEVASITVRQRRRMPKVLLTHARMKVDGPVIETWRLGYLIDTIYLRDLWMHRVDACRATGREVDLTAEHDGRIVADVVAEWARRHGAPFDLELTGPAGGRFRAEGEDADPITIDAIDFCRTLAGRAPGEGLLATVVPF